MSKSKAKKDKILLKSKAKKELEVDLKISAYIRKNFQWSFVESSKMCILVVLLNFKNVLR